MKKLTKADVTDIQANINGALQDLARAQHELSTLVVNESDSPFERNATYGEYLLRKVVAKYLLSAERLTADAKKYIKSA